MQTCLYNVELLPATFSKRLARWLKSTWLSPMMRRLAVVILWPLRDYMKSKESVCRWQRVWFLSRKDTNSYHFLLHKFLPAARDFACKRTQTFRTSSLVLWRRQGPGVTHRDSAAFDPHLVLPWPKSPKSISSFWRWKWVEKQLRRTCICMERLAS